MVENRIWNQLLKIESLRTGWHLVRLDTKDDFLRLHYSTQAFAGNLDAKLREIQRQLATDRYSPSPLIKVDVPKDTLAIRPASIPTIDDRVVLHSILALVAEQIDGKLSKSVYSYRVQRNRRSGQGLFREGAALELAFLKHKTIREELDPFEAWYESWPEFDEESRRAFEEEGYLYLAVSDISAYFENVQLPILRDLLLQLIPDEPRIVNLVFHFLETWSQKTLDGRHHWRGIPQGTEIGSFLGNIFLQPIDLEFGEFCSEFDAKYFRYMDDVKIFTKEYSTARRAILTLDRSLRQQHLNVQSAKTMILSEHPRKEISYTLTDERLDALKEIIDQIRNEEEISTEFRDHILVLLDRVSWINPKSPKERRLKNTHEQFTGLTHRVFRRWITAHTMIGSHVFVKRLLKEIEENPDNRLTRKLIATTKAFPNKRMVGTWLIKFLPSALNIYPYQEAELLWAARYLARIPKEVIAHCSMRLLDRRTDFYVRIQSAHLLSRTRLSNEMLRSARRLIEKEENPLVQGMLIAVLMQQKATAVTDLLEFSITHQNGVVRDIGYLFRGLAENESDSKRLLDHVFEDSAANWVLCDSLPSLFAVANSEKEVILSLLLKHLRVARRRPGVGDMSEVLDFLSDRVERRRSNS